MKKIKSILFLFALFLTTIAIAQPQSFPVQLIPPKAKTVQGPTVNIYEAILLDNKDGDSGRLLVRIPNVKKRFTHFDIIEMRFRLFRTDTHEMTDTDYFNGELARAAKYFTTSVTAGRILKIQYFGKDYYGRWLVNLVLPDGRTLNGRLEEKGYTTGKYTKAKMPKKEKFKDWKGWKKWHRQQKRAERKFYLK